MQTITIAPSKRSWFSLLSWAVVLAVLVVSWQGAEMAPLTLIKDGGNMATFAADFFPPDSASGRIPHRNGRHAANRRRGTALAVVLSIPFGLMSAEGASWWVYQPVRRLMDACRAINEMVFAMLFVVAVGLGPFAGVLALFTHTTGVLSKLLSEAVEAIEPGPVEGIRATGANKLEEILWRAATGNAAARSPTPSIASNPTSARRPSSAWSVQAGSASPCGSDSRFPVPANLRPDGAYHRHGQPAGFPLSTVA